MTNFRSFDWGFFFLYVLWAIKKVFAPLFSSGRYSVLIITWEGGGGDGEIFALNHPPAYSFSSSYIVITKGRMGDETTLPCQITKTCTGMCARIMKYGRKKLIGLLFTKLTYAHEYIFPSIYINWSIHFITMIYLRRLFVSCIKWAVIIRTHKVMPISDWMWKLQK